MEKASPLGSPAPLAQGARHTLLVVDDEQVFRDMLAELFGQDYRVLLAGNGLEALEIVERTRPDLILLDILMPGMDGFQTCLRLRQMEETQDIPVIFLTSKREPETETFGLELGADDFVAKPFNKEVLKARVRKRLGAGGPEAPSEVTQLDDYEIHWDRQEATRGEERIPLTVKEIRLLRLLVQNQGRVLTRDTILHKIWSDTFITDRTIDSHIKELRKKIPPLTRRIKTVYGMGYRLDT
jgi:two-component system alkaline phosphatase synthesis response regulator PhoP